MEALTWRNAAHFGKCHGIKEIPQVQHQPKVQHRNMLSDEKLRADGREKGEGASELLWSSSG